MRTVLSDLLDFDDYGILKNGPKTYAGIATLLKSGQSVATGWTSDPSTMLSLVLTSSALLVTEIQGIHPAAQTPRLDHILFVSVLRCGAFGFVNTVDRRTDLHPDYVAEKLGIGRGVTATALAELINGIMDCMQEG